MASILDISVLENFSNIFIFILVILILVILMSTSRFFGSNKAIMWIIAIVVGIFVLFSNVAINSIKFIIPWFIIVFVFIMFILIAIQAFGGSATDLSAFGSIRGVIILVIILGLIVGFLANIRDQTLPSPDNETGEIDMDYTKTSNIIFHPKVLGVIFIFLIAIFTVVLLAGKMS